MNRIFKVIKEPKKILFYLESKGFFNFLSDEKYLKFFYKLNMGKKLNLDNPKTFNEKLQWLKLYDRKDIYTTMVDKYEVKNYVASLIGEEYVVKNLGIWDNFDEIDFESLPDQFVLKCTHDSGGLVICRDKSKLDLEKAKAKINKSLNRNYYYNGREWPYKNVKPRIIAEKYLENKKDQGLRDYKFYCADGKVLCLYVSEGLEDHSTASISFLNKDWTFSEFKREDFKPFEKLPEKPEKYEEMLEISEKLSKGYKFLRVDLYEVAGKVYFSEFTFSPCSGYMPFSPKEWDEKLGKMVEI